MRPLAPTAPCLNMTTSHSDSGKVDAAPHIQQLHAAAARLIASWSIPPPYLLLTFLSSSLFVFCFLQVPPPEIQFEIV